MSRNNNRAAADAAKRLPPSHPVEQYEEHRAFLIRSLERNDKEIAALVELTRSLRSVKQEIIDQYGEMTLLDLGSGKIRLAPTGDGLVIEDHDDGKNDDTIAAATNTPQLDARARELCVDFLLRLKLRRKLLSRLFRRMNRVAHAMDGNDVGPPAPPRYGDLRLHIEPSEVAAYQEHWKRQQEARRVIEQLKDESFGAGAVVEKGSNDESLPVDNQDGSDDSEMKDAESATGHPEVPTAQQQNSLQKNAIDYGALVSFNEGYEKSVNPETGEFKYTILDQPHEEDYMKIKFGTGIGAVQRGMTLKEKELEYNRWQTALLSRIPEQPTYAELGLEHRVFFEAERRKRALETAKKASSKKRTFADDDDERPEKGRGGKSLRKLQEEKDAKDMKNIADSDDVEQEIATEGVDIQASPDDKDKASDLEAPQEASTSMMEEGKVQEGNSKEEKQSSENVEDNTEEAHVTKRSNPISLAPVPSFYDQDLKRIRMIHADLLTASIQAHACQRLEEVVRGYNQALRVSQDTSRRRQQVDFKLQQVIFETKRDQAEYQRRVGATHGEWLKRLQAFNNEKLNKTFKSRWNQKPQGTRYTAHYGSRPDPIMKEVALCGADMVDAVELISEGKVNNPIFNEPFVPPPDALRMDEVDPTTGKSPAQQRLLFQQQLKKESDALAQQFRQGEEERQRAWRRMLKVKADLNIPQPIISNGRHVQVPISDHNYHAIPMPSLGVANMESMPRELDVSRSVLPSYVPTHQSRMPEVAGSDSGSKYTVARTRARISADGSVAPVSLTNRGADGLYARPSGRTRKGMDWDAVNGKWVPISS